MLKVLSALVVSAAVLSSTPLLDANKTRSVTPTSSGEETILYQNDFSNPLTADDILYEGFTVENGVAKNGANSTIMVPTVESNDYSLSFDIKGDGSNFYAFFGNVAGGNEIRYGVEAQGAYYFTRTEDSTGIYDVYNNSMPINGGMIDTPIDLEGGAHLEFKFIDGTSEIWVDGTLRAITNLDNFGNLRYQRRKHFDEQPLTYLRFEWNGGYELDNFVWEEINNDNSVGIVADKTNTVIKSGYFGLPWGGEVLTHDNYKIETKFKMNDELSGDTFHRVVLGGLNNDLHDKVNNGENGDADSYLDFELIMHEDKTAHINVYSHKVDQMWINHFTEGNLINLSDAPNNEIILTTEVQGENVFLSVNGELLKSWTFNDLGFSKGTLQYVTLFHDSDKNCTFENSTFYGYDTEEGAYIYTPETEVFAGETFTINSSIFPSNYSGTYEWYVNDAATGETDDSYTFTDAAEGTYKVQLKSSDFESNILNINVVGKMITITADKLSGYQTDTFEITSTILGDFSSEAPKWYVDGEVRESETDKLVLTNLNPGTHTVELKSSDCTSNVITIEIVRPSLTIESDKTGFYVGETYDFKANLEGISGDVTYEWYLDGSATPIEGVTGDTYHLDTTGMEKGTTHTLYVKVGNVESEIISFFIITNPLEELEQEENWQSIYNMTIEDGVEYGTFIGRKEGDRTYLEANVDGALAYKPTDMKFPSSTTYSLKMDVWVPETVDKPYYYYPTWDNMFGAGKGGETAVEIGTAGLRPYVKNQSNQASAEVNLGKDLTYGAGISKAGDWNTIELVMYNKFVAAYINGEMVMFTTMPNITYPSGLTLCAFPDGGSGRVPIKISNVSVTDLVVPAPDLEQVRVTTSANTISLGESVTFTAQLVPFNAEATTIEWYVNDQKVDGSEMRYTFTPETSGTYKVHCVIDGITSNAINLTVNDSNGGDTPENGGQNNIGYIIGGVIGGVVVLGGIGVGVYFYLKNKKKK